MGVEVGVCVCCGGGGGGSEICTSKLSYGSLARLGKVFLGVNSIIFILNFNSKKAHGL